MTQISWHWLLISLSPAVLWVWLYARLLRTPTGIKPLYWLFLLGGMACLPALIFNHLLEKYSSLWHNSPDPLHQNLFWILGVGLNEEFFKIFPVLLLLCLRRELATTKTGLLAGIFCGAGFAFVENLVYLERYGEGVLLMRSLLTIPAHASFTAFGGLACTLAIQKPKHALLLLLNGLLWASLLHGLYDILVSFQAWHLQVLAYLMVLSLSITHWWIMRPKKQMLASQ